MSEPEIGITDEDRAKMAEWAESGPPGLGGPRGESWGGLPRPDHPVVKKVRLEVVCQAVIDGVQYTTAARLAEELPYTANQIGKALARLEMEGRVEKDGTKAWRILEDPQ